MNFLIPLVPALFYRKPESSILSIDKTPDDYSFDVTDDDKTIKTVQASLECLKECIGEARLKRICQRQEISIDVDKIDQGTLILTKDVVRKIFAGLMDIRKEDLDELDLSLEEKFQLLDNIKSLKEVEAYLMGASPKLAQFKFDLCKTSGKGFKGLLERIYLSKHQQFKVIEETNIKAAQLRDVEFLTSRMADRELQKGSLVHLHDGCFYVDEVFIGGGAYASLLMDIEGIKTPKIVCRGTAMRPTATDGLLTGINDILIEIGTMGVKNISVKLLTYLKEKKVTSVEVLGKSLGGAHAQELAILIEGVANIKVDRLITLSSVGVGKGINDLFKKEILGNRSTPFQIQVIRNGGHKQSDVDYIPAVGGVHLGNDTEVEKCHIEVCYMQPGNKEAGIYPLEIGFYELSKNFLKSFIDAHCRQTTLDRFTWKTLSGRDEVDQHLSTGNRLEGIRQCFAYAIHASTLKLLNGQSFTSFFYDQQQAAGSELDATGLHREQLIAPQR